MTQKIKIGDKVTVKFTGTVTATYSSYDNATVKTKEGYYIEDLPLDGDVVFELNLGTNREQFDALPLGQFSVYDIDNTTADRADFESASYVKIGPLHYTVIYHTSTEPMLMHIAQSAIYDDVVKYRLEAIK